MYICPRFMYIGPGVHVYRSRVHISIGPMDHAYM